MLRCCIPFLLVLFVMAGVVAAPAQFGMPLNHSDPKLEAVNIREIVERYCRLDYAGVRLNPADWPKMQPLVAWQTDTEYAFFMPSSRFDVETEVVPQHGKYLVTVHYRLIGRFDMAQGYSQESADQLEDAEFVVSEVNGDWRITEIRPNYPHPSRAATLQWFNKKLAQAQEPASKTIYQHALADLQSQKTPAPGQ